LYHSHILIPDQPNCVEYKCVIYITFDLMDITPYSESKVFSYSCLYAEVV
jgi:hypothetical protein